jgi:hypothetical protein
MVIPVVAPLLKCAIGHKRSRLGDFRGVVEQMLRWHTSSVQVATRLATTANGIDGQ